jgi:hypothetical protein
MNTLLLTGTIKPNADVLFLNIKDPLTRYQQYMQSITKYICFSDFDYIVFCENSWFEIKHIETLMGIAKVFWKKLEILQFNGNHEKSVKKGRWFWENEIIEYAIKHSNLIKKSWKFIKITWRYWCENINKIISWSKNQDICFSKLMPVSIRKLDTKAVNTAIFKTTVWFFNKVLAWAGEQVDDNKIIFLEHVYFDRLKKFSKEIHPLPEYPKMRWITGEWWTLKKSAIIETIIYFLHKIWINKI